MLVLRYEKQGLSILFLRSLVAILIYVGFLFRRQRWSRFLRQPGKVDLTTQRTIHHEDAETIFG
jgi:hypothetical protein